MKTVFTKEFYPSFYLHKYCFSAVLEFKIRKEEPSLTVRAGKELRASRRSLNRVKFIRKED